MTAIRRFLTLPAAARAIVARSLLLLPVVAALLGMTGFARTRAWLRPPHRRAPAIEALEPREVARLVHGAAARLRVGCLPRSLVLLRFLDCYGERVHLRFGVLKTPEGSLEAHAWIELDGAALCESANLLTRYAALPAPPAQPIRDGRGIRGAQRCFPAE